MDVARTVLLFNMPKPPIGKLKKKLHKQAKQICRTRASCIMQGADGAGRCGGYIQASHIKSEGAWKNLFIDPRNIFPMCYRHHITLWHKDPTEWVTWFKKTHPEDYAYLEVAKLKHIDFNNAVILERLYEASLCGYDIYRYEYEKIYAGHAV